MTLKIFFPGFAPYHNYKAGKTIKKFVDAGGELLTRDLKNGNTVRSISIPYKDGKKSYVQVLDKKNNLIFDKLKTRTSHMFSSLNGQPLWAKLFGGKVIK